MSRVAGTRNLVPMVLSYPPLSRSAGWVGENPGNEVGGPAPWNMESGVGRGEKGCSFPSSLSRDSRLSRVLACSPIPTCEGDRSDTKACVSWGKAFHKLLEIFQKVSRNFSKSCSKVAKKKQSKVALGINESCSKVAQKNKNEFWSDAKKCNFYNKSKISKHFCAILWRNQRC